MSQSVTNGKRKRKRREKEEKTEIQRNGNKAAGVFKRQVVMRHIALRARTGTLLVANIN